MPCIIVLNGLQSDFNNSLILQWISVRPTKTGSNLSVNYPLVFYRIYAVSGITICYNCTITSNSNPYHDTTVARAGVLQTDSDLTDRPFQKNCVIIRRPDSGYRFSYIALGSYS